MLQNVWILSNLYQFVFRIRCAQGVIIHTCIEDGVRECFVIMCVTWYINESDQSEFFVTQIILVKTPRRYLWLSQLLIMMIMMVLDTLEVHHIFAYITCKKHIVLHILNSSIQANNSAQCIFVHILNFLEKLNWPR